MAERDVSEALRDALVARPDIAERADRCRAVLQDLLGADVTHRREVALLVAAVEEHVPEALRNATTLGDVDSVTTRFRADRALDPTAAQWAVDVWSEALNSLGVTSIPTSALTVDAPREAPSNWDQTEEDSTRLTPASPVWPDDSPSTVVGSSGLGGEPPVPMHTEPPDGGPPHRRRLVLIGAGALTVLAAAALIFALTRGDDRPTVRTEPTVQPSTTARKATTTTRPRTTTTVLTAGHIVLRDHLPAELKCKPARSLFGKAATLACERDGATLTYAIANREVVKARTEARGRDYGALVREKGCTKDFLAPSIHHYHHHGNREEEGHLLCYLSANGPVLEWDQFEVDTYAVARRADNDFAKLYAQWESDDFGPRHGGGSEPERRSELGT